ncbi:MAG: hypothetical protein KatS3mg009_0385 [Acidimicrobiia bacterium]|nr:MAG: hypothetical protein KatS3mg009_0385 [Acidimicrobiia bacterium]
MRRWWTAARAAAAAALVTAGTWAAATPVHAETATDGTRTLTVTPTRGLDPAGQVVQVSGAGYDTTKGIYVAFCVVPPPGQLPSPCGGGAGPGAEGAARWITSNPPPYGAGLAQPYGPGGSFSTTLVVTPTIGTVDCRATPCAVVTRNDHTRTADRSQDLVVPVTFAPAPPPTAPPTAPPATPAPTVPAASGGPAGTPASGPGGTDPTAAPAGGAGGTAGATTTVPGGTPTSVATTTVTSSAPRARDVAAAAIGDDRGDPGVELADAPGGGDGAARVAFLATGAGGVAAAATFGTWWWRRRRDGTP